MERISSASRSRRRLRIALPDLVWIDRCGGRSDGHLHQAVRRVPGLRLSLLLAEVSKEVLSQRTNDYQRWVEAYARNHSIPIEWAEKGVRKEDHVLPWLHRMAPTEEKLAV